MRVSKYNTFHGTEGKDSVQMAIFAPSSLLFLGVEWPDWIKWYENLIVLAASLIRTTIVVLARTLQHLAIATHLSDLRSSPQRRHDLLTAQPLSFEPSPRYQDKTLTHCKPKCVAHDPQ